MPVADTTWPFHNHGAPDTGDSYCYTIRQPAYHSDPDILCRYPVPHDNTVPNGSDPQWNGIRWPHLEQW